MTTIYNFVSEASGCPPSEQPTMKNPTIHKNIGTNQDTLDLILTNRGHHRCYQSEMLSSVFLKMETSHLLDMRFSIKSLVSLSLMTKSEKNSFLPLPRLIGPTYV